MVYPARMDKWDNPDSQGFQASLAQRVLQESLEELLMPQMAPRERKDSLATWVVMGCPGSKERWVTWEEKAPRV